MWKNQPKSDFRSHLIINDKRCILRYLKALSNIFSGDALNLYSRFLSDIMGAIAVYSFFPKKPLLEIDSKNQQSTGFSCLNRTRMV
ncbi:MAG: hypothetical protein CVU11_00705 [Bacteroidetes bacterium HGW-Bacteroidetes-6]|jgi:hypothetical protein|nr:MAG: hypothetical protein CVU11_00705 [Bacteroidetes bacterium HGW-Bacteroidetes-6]